MQIFVRCGKRTIVAALVLALLALGAVRPRTAVANEATTIAIAGAAVAAWFVIVIAATYFIYGREPDANALVSPDGRFRDLRIPAQEERSGVRFGPDCMRLTGNPTAVCW